MAQLSESIITKKEEGVFTITLNRPDVLNGFNREMSLSFQKAIEHAATDSTTRCVYLTGAGRAFCSGQDLSEVKPDAQGNVPELGAIVRECYNPIILGLRSLEKPVVCAVNGVAAGAGANLAFACDIVVAASDTVFIQSFGRVGLIPDSGGTFFLPRIVGLARATAMTFLGDKMTATEAQTLGLIYKVVESSELQKEAMSLAKRLAAMPTRGLALTKIALQESFNNCLSEQLELEERLQGEAGRTRDYKEGVTAFIEKRSPKFLGE